MAETPPIVLYHYAFSPYARRIQWYLLLRGLPYSECMQPPVMPRPDLERLGVHHRRIPVLAIGRDVYIDTRLMLRKLEQIPSTSASVRPPLGVGAVGGRGELLALERLVDGLTTDSGLFSYCASLIPPNLPVMRDPVFLRDRASFKTGKALPPSPKTTSSSSPARTGGISLARAEALVEVRHAAALLESTLLADGRTWLLGTPEPSLADIEAVWPFHWLSTMPGAFCADFGDDGTANTGRIEGLSPTQYPRLFAWIGRFDAAVRAARRSATAAAPVARLDGQQAAAAIWAAPFFEDNNKEGAAAAIQPDDPVAQVAGLRVGQPVVVSPTDTGTTHKDVGRLVRLNDDEVVLAVVSSAAAAGDQPPALHLHAPRHGFTVRPARTDSATGAKL